MNKIAFIARGLSKNGVRSFIEAELEKENQKKESIYFVFTDEKKYVEKFSNLNIIYIKRFNKIIWDYFLLPYYLYKHKIKKVIYTKNIIPFTHSIFKWEKVIYVLDLAFKYPELKAYKLDNYLYMNLFLGFSLKIADKIIAISKFTKKEILKFYPEVNSKKIIVKYLPINQIFKKNINKTLLNKVKNKYNLSNNFIFYCGSISPRKNILFFLKAFNKVKKDISQDLYLVSSRIWSSPEVADYINKNLKKRVRIIENVTDEELAVFYSLADLFVYPSLYEGFGLPIKEAEACGCKVLTSNFGAMKEISSNKNILVDSKNIDKFSNALLKELSK